MRKSQSAMEYLMTYGWAILIIAVVLGALFQLGVFNSSSFSPRAPPGACQVFRPGGPGTTQNINLMGVCTGQLPQYVGVFNGVGSYVDYGYMSRSKLSTTLTYSVWINSASTTGAHGILGNFGSGGCTEGGTYAGLNLDLNSGRYIFLRWGDSSGVYNSNTLPPLNANQWNHLAVTFDGASSLFYVNGVSTGASISSLCPAGMNWHFYAGVDMNNGFYFNGMITDAQVYNTSLSANQVQALYLGGLGGAPQKLQNLVGWWPLNGDVKDYSGNNNNGVPTAVTFTSQYGK